MMKIDIITLHSVKNYGSVLQAFATQELFRLHGFEPRVINFEKKEVKKENLATYWAGNNILKRIIIYPTIKRWEDVFDDFNRNYLNLTKQVYCSESDFIGYKCDADVYCTGSDQVWNSVWNNGILRPLYLSFVPEERYKISFSSSFGQATVSDEEVVSTKFLISRYNQISVREKSGISILKNLYNYSNAVHVVDPTLGLDADFWRHYKSTELQTGNYILIYNLNRSREFDRYAKRLSLKTGTPLVRICTRFDQFYRVGKSIFIPDIPQFISLIDNAKYVLTDSFHATAFSLNMGTEPICILPSKFGNRIEEFLIDVESSQRIVRNLDDFDVINRPVDFTLVNKKLLDEREKMSMFIESVKKKAKDYYGLVN